MLEVVAGRQPQVRQPRDHRSFVYHVFPAAEFFNMIAQVVINEDYRMGQLVQKSLDPGIGFICIIGRNETGVQNMHRQMADVMRGGA